MPVASSPVVRFAGLTHAYLIDPVIESCAQAADNALAAMRVGADWDLTANVGRFAQYEIPEAFSWSESEDEYRSWLRLTKAAVGRAGLRS